MATNTMTPDQIAELFLSLTPEMLASTQKLIDDKKEAKRIEAETEALKKDYDAYVITCENTEITAIHDTTMMDTKKKLSKREEQIFNYFMSHYVIDTQDEYIENNRKKATATKPKSSGGSKIKSSGKGGKNANADTPPADPECQCLARRLSGAGKKENARCNNIKKTGEKYCQGCYNTDLMYGNFSDPTIRWGYDKINQDEIAPSGLVWLNKMKKNNPQWFKY